MVLPDFSATGRFSMDLAHINVEMANAPETVINMPKRVFFFRDIFAYRSLLIRTGPVRVLLSETGGILNDATACDQSPPITARGTQWRYPTDFDANSISKPQTMRLTLHVVKLLFRVSNEVSDRMTSSVTTYQSAGRRLSPRTHYDPKHRVRYRRMSHAYLCGQLRTEARPIEGQLRT